jgi:hypothetical protein
VSRSTVRSRLVRPKSGAPAATQPEDVHKGSASSPLAASFHGETHAGSPMGWPNSSIDVRLAVGVLDETTALICLFYQFEKYLNLKFFKTGKY